MPNKCTNKNLRNAIRDMKKLNAKMHSRPIKSIETSTRPPFFTEPPILKQNPTTEDLLAEREKTHGDFKRFAQITQELKRAVWQQVSNLSDPQKEAVEMICNKLARILNGHANFKDHWDDIAGYATLISREL